MGEEKKGFFKRLVSGLTKTRDNIVSGMDSIFHGFSKIDDDFYEELEETLIMGDLGVRATMDIIEDLKVKVKEQHIKEPIECRQLVIDSIREQMDVGETAYEFENRQSVVFVIGVNGVGKTTTIGKLAGKLKAQNKKVILAAADTFRAAAGEQLKEWSNRAGVEMIGGQEGADPASVVYDAVAAAKARRADVCRFLSKTISVNLVAVSSPNGFTIAFLKFMSQPIHLGNRLKARLRKSSGVKACPVTITLEKESI